MIVSLRDAARLLNVSEESVRRKILLGEIAATPVDDDRHYLVTLEPGGTRAGRGADAPTRCAPFFYLKIGFALFLIALIAAIASSAMAPRKAPLLCLRCAAVADGAGCCPAIRADGLTETIREAHPEPCEHEWVRLIPAGAKRSLRFVAEEFNRLRVVEAARHVDPQGAAELVRWCLGREAIAREFLDRARFETAREFRAWFADLRSRAESR